MTSVALIKYTAITIKYHLLEARMEFSIEVFANWAIAISYPVLVIFAFTIFGIDKFKKRKNCLYFKQIIERKIGKNLSINSEDCSRILRASGLSTQQAIQLIYEMMYASDDESKFKGYTEVLISLEKLEPFGNLPTDLKQVIHRLVQITENTGSDSDKYLLIPLQKALENSKIVEEKQNRSKVMNNFVICMGVGSLVISIASYYISTKSPSKAEMVEIVEQGIKNSKN